MCYIDTGRATAAALLQIILTPFFCLLHFSIVQLQYYVIEEFRVCWMDSDLFSGDINPVPAMTLLSARLLFIFLPFWFFLC
jgi:hypothetical protein